MTKCQEQSRWICRAFGLPSCQQVSQRILTQPLPEQTGQLAAACSLTLRESHNISCATVVLSSKLVPMVMLKKKAKMMAVTEVGPNAVQGRMWGWEGSEVRGRGYFISPHNSPTPCTSSNTLELHWQGRSPCRRRKRRVREPGFHPALPSPWPQLS